MSALIITEEELALVKSYVLLPMVLTVLDRDAKLIANAGLLRSPEPYVDAITNAMNRVSEDLRDVRRQFRSRGIKVFEEVREVKSVNVRYLCRGYEHSMTLLWELVGKDVKERIREYFGLTRE
ncbi:hypothetical protein NQ117_05170 [Paenibacillus sp. SC116]|uniref:hypothetical protein n=1 Tax=Paenibacillus sp. SC116 TaxID=2968986 RepID=UPI00215A8984|nr:hypothetical protein [Paenibacillus sp. SC116]MCR8843062.1 hypothetical protein [Paenibacillus sp. SC116]